MAVHAVRRRVAAIRTGVGHGSPHPGQRGRIDRHWQRWAGVRISKPSEVEIRRSPDPPEARTDANDGTPSLRAVPVTWRPWARIPTRYTVARDWRWARATVAGRFPRRVVIRVRPTRADVAGRRGRASRIRPTGRRRGAEPPTPTRSPSR